MNDVIKVIAQAFYGNRTEVDIKQNDVDSFILGYLDDTVVDKKRVNRTIVRIPNVDNVVIVYNKLEEEKERNRKEELFKEENYVLKPLVVIEEDCVEIYSRCIVCRVDEHGELASLEDGDYEKVAKYLAE